MLIKLTGPVFLNVGVDGKKPSLKSRQQESHLVALLYKCSLKFHKLFMALVNTGVKDTYTFYKKFIISQEKKPHHDVTIISDT